MTKNFIRTQGDLDGACFLYALANATQAITNLQITTTAWSAMVAELSNPMDFLDQGCGTRHSDGDVFKQENLANRLLKGLSPRGALTAKNLSPLNKHCAFDEIITNRSALVLGSPQHWYCIVDFDSDNLYIACSWSLHEQGHQYKERKSRRLGRTYNRVDSRERLRVFQSRGFMVAK